MKNTKLITLVAGALLLTQAIQAAEETALSEVQTQLQSAQAQPIATPAAPQACVTLTKQELSDTIKASIAEELTKTAQKPVQAQSNITKPLTIIAPQKPIFEHQITRTGKETFLPLKQDTNDIYSITLQEGDTLVLKLKTYHAGFSWKVNMMGIEPEILRYDRKAYQETQQVDEYGFPLLGGGSTFYMYFTVIGDGKGRTQELIFDYENAVGMRPTSQQLKITTIRQEPTPAEQPKTVIPTPVTPAPAVTRPTLALNRTVEVGRKFVVEKEEDTASGETYSFDSASSDTDRFELVEEVYATKNPDVKKSHYFVFKALKEGSGDLVFIGKKNQPEQTWHTTHRIAVE